MTSLYIHIPFCKKKCSYCDFVSYAGKEDQIDEYVEAIIRELESQLSTFHSPLSTIYFGGGTPTLLKPKHFEEILTHYPLRITHCEITVEANPGTINKEYLTTLRKLGTNRLSIGAQSFNDKHLKTLGRIHDSKQIHQAVEDARAAGFDNINLDLIFALPNQTLEEWKKDLSAAVSLCPEHLSTYNLQIEPGTELADRVENHELPVTSEDLDADMYEHTINYLKENGYNHYEISNFAKPGFECKHNINYWLNGNYIGIGTGAHSHIDGKRWENTSSVEEYLSSSNYALPITQYDASIFMGLRLLDGIPIEKFAGYMDQVRSLTKEGLLEESNGNIKLTKKGLFLGNLVFEKFV